MRVIQVSTYDKLGGAAVAARRLNEALNVNNLSSELLVQKQSGNYPNTTVFSPPTDRITKLKLLASRLAYKLESREYEAQSVLFKSEHARCGDLLLSYLNADIIHLHWGLEFFDHSLLMPRITSPVVWTFHDMFAFTGGCFYSDGCEKYLQGCGACPIIQSSNPRDISYKIWKRKMQAFNQRKLVGLAPSRWLADLAKASPIWAEQDVRVMPNALNTDIFLPFDRREAGKTWNLDPSRKTILFGAGKTDDPRKGADLMVSALHALAQNPDTPPLQLLIFGGADDSINSLPFPIIKAGYLQEGNQMAQAYAAADLMVIPSRQDNLPNTAVEALSCGTPIAAFNIGGLPDLVSDGETGHLAKPFDPESLAHAITQTLSMNLGKVRETTRKMAISRFSYPVVAALHRALYEELKEDTKH